jgi:hypothetical protein
VAEQTYRTRIDDLAILGEELTEEHLRLVAGAAGKKKQAGPGQKLDGTSTAAGTTYVHTIDGVSHCETDGDED